MPFNLTLARLSRSERLIKLTRHDVWRHVFVTERVVLVVTRNKHLLQVEVGGIHGVRVVDGHFRATDNCKQIEVFFSEKNVENTKDKVYLK